MARARKNAGLDRGETLARSARWLVEVAGLELPPASPAQRYLEWLAVRAYSERTVRHRRVYLGYFLAWCEARSLRRPVEVTRPILERYQRHLYHARKAAGRPLSFTSQTGRVAVVRGFFRWLVRENALLAKPAADLVMPRPEKRLPRAVLSPLQAEAVMNQPNVGDPVGLRDRAMLETLYSTGMRRSELLALKVDDLDAERGTVMIRLGKGRKDRLIPIGERAVLWIDKYLREVRPGLALGRDEGILFLTELGESLVPEYVTHCCHARRMRAAGRSSGRLFDGRSGRGRPAPITDVDWATGPGSS